MVKDDEKEKIMEGLGYVDQIFNMIMFACKMLESESVNVKISDLKIFQ